MTYLKCTKIGFILKFVLFEDFNIFPRAQLADACDLRAILPTVVGCLESLLNEV